ncbi:hypothetical protein OB920_17470 [Halobacteria archaeon HArc-gm2]|nr:hypothetical protein [Halobacteria archaeon HArc-gm2]
MDLLDLEDEAILFVIGFVMALFVAGIIAVSYLTIDLTESAQAQIIATVLGAIGTLALALATVYNIFQTNRNLALQEKDRRKPIVKDELTNLIQPAINSLQENLQTIEESDQDGCTFDWVYLDQPTLYSVSRGPQSVQTPDSLPSARLFSEDQMLYGTLNAHDNYVSKVANEASKFHKEMVPEYERLLEEDNTSLEDQSLKVISTQVLAELDHFAEGHDLYEFWEENRNSLIEYATNVPEVTLQDIQAAERVYRREIVEDGLSKLKQRKARLKQEYGISESEIISMNDEWRDW